MGEVVAVAFPSQGHINAMLHLCHILASHGCKVTLCNALAIHQQLMAITGDSAHANARCDLRSGGGGEYSDEYSTNDDYSDEYRGGGKISYVGLFAPLKSDATGSGSGGGGDNPGRWEPIMEMLGDSLHSFLLKRKNSSRGGDGGDATPPPPPPSCIISDVLVSTATQRVADLHGLPRIAFLPFSQTFNLLYFLKIPLPSSLHDKLRDYGDTSTIKIACNVPPIQSYCLPTYFHKIDATEITHSSFLNQFGALHKAERVLVNSFWEIEDLAIQAIPNIYPIGPLFTQNSNNKHQQNLKRKSLLLEEVACLEWLDNQPQKSVIYVCFGSITLLSKSQMQELATGIEESGYKALIVFRPKMINDAPDAFGSEFFANTITNNQSFIVTWAPQMQVLSHPSIGAFLTHCGWNSVIESIWHGVPMLCWPYFADQMLNAQLVVDTWKIGTNLTHKENEFVPREKVKKMVGLIMGENEGSSIRTRIANLKDAALRNTMEGGISWNNIKSLIEMINARHNRKVGK